METLTEPFIDLLRPTDPRWQEALAKVRYDFFHLPGYLAASAAHEGNEAQMFLLDAGSHGMLVPFLKRPLSEFGEDYRSFFDAASPYGYSGPLYWGELTPEALASMHRQFEACMREQRIVTIFLRLHPFLTPPVDWLEPLGQVVNHGPTIYMDLRDPEASWNDINSRNRSSINKLLRDGSTVEFDQWQML